MKCPYCAGQVRTIGKTIFNLKVWCPLCRRTCLIEKPQPPKPFDNPYVCFNHQGKADALVKALAPKYVQSETDGHRLRFVLTDNDIKGRQRQLQKFREMGAVCLVYPHAARPSLVNDHYAPWEYTAAQFVVNEYHAEVLRLIGYKKPIESIGWFLCPIREFRQTKAKNILFAPIHPRNAPQDRKVNSETFEKLYPLAKSGEINLTIRYIGDLVDNGLVEQTGVTYVQGRMNQSFEEIDAADVVIGHQTIAWIAIARGMPTVMMAEDMPTHFRKTNQQYEDAKSWKQVSHLFRYPLDILDTSDTLGLLQQAAKSDDDVKDWRARMIGEPLQKERLIEAVERHL